ncbi:MAG: DUF1273 family protein [Clostridia bacterium]|nr:DUF1273 family protein [Clostridia bacterium]
MKSRTCCFSGHRDVPVEDVERIKNQLRVEVENLINKGVVFYGTGGARGFDLLAAEVVLELKKKYSHIRLIFVLPCFNQTKYWNKCDKEKYRIIINRADKVKVLSYAYTKDCMLTRNRHLVDNSAYIICYNRKNTGGTDYTVNYAEKQNLKIIRV